MPLTFLKKMTEEKNELELLREEAKNLGIKNYHLKGKDKLLKEIGEAKDETMTGRLEPDGVDVAINPDVTTHKHYFTDPKTGRIGEYMLIDARNPIPHNQKGTAYKFVKWV